MSNVMENIKFQAYKECCGSCPQAKKCHEDCSEGECEQYTERVEELRKLKVTE